MNGSSSSNGKQTHINTQKQTDSPRLRLGRSDCHQFGTDIKTRKGETILKQSDDHHFRYWPAPASSPALDCTRSCVCVNCRHSCKLALLFLPSAIVYNTSCSWRCLIGGAVDRTSASTFIWLLAKQTVVSTTLKSTKNWLCERLQYFAAVVAG